MPPTQEKRSVFALIEGSHDDVQVVRLDGDRFVVTVQQAIDMCSLASSAVRFQSEFSDLMNRLYEWVEERKSRVDAAYLAVGRDGVKLLVVQKDVAADFNLEDELVQLDIDVANGTDFTLVPFNTLLVPKVSSEVLQSFLTSGNVMEHQFSAEQRESSDDSHQQS